jgi:hypothetical protein
VAGRSSIQLKITILLLWLIETDVFQLPQLHKHFNVVCHPVFSDISPISPGQNAELLKLFAITSNSTKSESC